MKEKLYIAAVLVLCLVLCCASCKWFTGIAAQAPPAADAPTQAEEPAATEETVSLRDKELESCEPPVEYLPREPGSIHYLAELPDGFTYEDKAGESALVSGSLLYHIKGARLVNNVNDIPDAGGFLDTPVLTKWVNGERKTYSYPDFILSDGSFMEDFYLILVDMTVENADAAGDTERGLWTDPYVFNTGMRFTLVNTQVLDGHKFYDLMEVRYFSGKWEVSDGNTPSAVRIEPGQSKEYTFGYFINLGPNRKGETPDAAKLCLCDTYGNRDSTLLNLGLENP